jgi:DNA polymerase
MYARDKSTRILCLAFCLPGQDPLFPSLWAPPMGGHPAMEDYPLDPDGVPYSLERLFQYIRDGGILEAHNVNFEATIWRWIAVRPMDGDEGGATGMGAPPVKDSQWRCSAAKCSALALPRDLEGAGEAMELPYHVRKNPGAGKRFIERYCKPRPPRKGEPKVDEETGEPIFYWHEYDRDEFLSGYRYCQQDVTAEHYLSESMPDLTEREYQVWLADFRANMRGVRIDRELVVAAIQLEAELKAEMNATLRAVTECEEYPEGIAGSERAKLLAWLNDRGVFLPDSTAETLDHFMTTKRYTEAEHGDPVATVVMIARQINRASVSKYKKILSMMDPDDDRVRELVMFHGAATGRWSGKGIQVQNFPKGLERWALLGIPMGHPMGSMEELVKDIKSRNLGWLKVLYKDVLTALSSALRGTLIPAPGKVFWVADYAAIEARVVLWLAGAKKALEVFERGEDIYMDMASGIYGYPVTDKKKQAKERGFGKVAILGLGYGMGWLTFLLTMRGAPYNIKFKAADALSILGDNAEVYINWIKKQLWPKAPDETKFKSEEKYTEAKRKYKSAMSKARMDLRRLEEARETPEDIIEEMALCKFVVDTYRERYPEVKKLWADQEAAACRAIIEWKKAKSEADKEWEEQQKLGAAYLRTEDATFRRFRGPTPLHHIECGKITWVVEEDRWLFAYLPSGRRIAYNCPDVKGQKTPWGETKPSMRFMGCLKGGSRKWGRMSAYGGLIVENVDQATARDLMADSLVRVDSGYDSEFQYDFIASIHDEGLAEGDDVDPALIGDERVAAIKHKVRDYEGLMERLEPCYAGLPVAAEGERLTRYQK